MSKKILVNKFGGGIMVREFIPLTKKRLQEQLSAGYQPIVVVSALKGITDEILGFLSKLEEAAGKNKNLGQTVNQFTENLLKKHVRVMTNINIKTDGQKQIKSDLEKTLYELKNDLMAFGSFGASPKLSAKLPAYGEKFSAIIMAGYLNFSGLQAKRFFAEDIPIITDDNFINADIKYQISEKNIRRELLTLKQIPVIAGFTGKTLKGDTTILGRGGTDTTACFIAAALRADKVILWKDVGGVLSADPKIVPKAETIPFISYQEAEEAGKVIHEKAIQYVKLFKTTAEIASLIDPKCKTSVGATHHPKKGAKIVSFRKNLSLFIITEEKIKMNELLAMTCETFTKYKVDIILISNARYILQIAADNSNGMVNKVFEELKSKVTDIKLFNSNMIFLIGNFDMKDVNAFNDLLIKHKTNLEISAFLYENCTRIEAIIGSNKIDDIVKVLYKKFIK